MPLILFITTNPIKKFSAFVFASKFNSFLKGILLIHFWDKIFQFYIEILEIKREYTKSHLTLLRIYNGETQEIAPTGLFLR